MREGVKGLILAGGEGSRLRPFTLSAPKHLIPLLGKAIIEYPLTHLVEAGVRDIGIVVGYMGDMIKDYLSSRWGRRLRLRFVYQRKRLGIAHAIHLAISEGIIDGPFVVYLGDNILAHGIGQYLQTFMESGADAYILLCEVKDPSRFGVAVLEEGEVKRLIEKPKTPISRLAVTGIYFFRDPELVKKAFASLKPSWRGEYEITDLIQWFIDKGYRVGYGIVNEWWKDVGTPESLLEALYLLLNDLDSPGIKGKVSGEVRGKVYIDEGAVVEGVVYGPAYIGKNALVADKALVEHYVSLEKDSAILSGSISRALVLDESVIDIKTLRISDSVIGKKARVSSRRELYGTIKLAISDYSRVEL